MKKEPFLMCIHIVDTDTNNIIDIFNREDFNNELNIPIHPDSKSQYIEVGDTLTVDEEKYKVVRINFMLFREMNEKYKVQNTKLTPNDCSCQIGVFVEKV